MRYDQQLLKSLLLIGVTKAAAKARYAGYLSDRHRSKLFSANGPSGQCTVRAKWNLVVLEAVNWRAREAYKLMRSDRFTR